ncbi:hypothetical protein SCALM49S_08676 [Streptomyces californicus]
MTRRAVLPYPFAFFFALLLYLLFLVPEFRTPFGYLFGMAFTERACLSEASRPAPQVNAVRPPMTASRRLPFLQSCAAMPRLMAAEAPAQTAQPNMPATANPVLARPSHFFQPNRPSRS